MRPLTFPTADMTYFNYGSPVSSQIAAAERFHRVRETEEYAEELADRLPTRCMPTWRRSGMTVAPSRRVSGARFGDSVDTTFFCVPA